MISPPRKSEDRSSKLDNLAIGRVPFKNGSVCYLISAWGDFDAIRNIAADYVAVDEVQKRAFFLASQLC
jgi:hypothetical protein